MPATKPVRAGFAWYIVQSAEVTGGGVMVLGPNVTGVICTGRDGGTLLQPASTRSAAQSHSQAYWATARGGAIHIRGPSPLLMHTLTTHLRPEYRIGRKRAKGASGAGPFSSRQTRCGCGRRLKPRLDGLRPR
ncbi:MAG: hypothetical protein ACRDHP_02555, partial [Ktedonobacterales bacterium]